MQLARPSLGILSIIGLFISGCETTNPHENLDIKSSVSSLKANKAMQPQVAQAFLLLKEAKYVEASSYINQTLQSQPKSVIFHILNALTYEKMAETGDGAGMELAAVGYQNAIDLDPYNSFAITQLGKLKYRDQKFDQAQEHFANALILKPNDPDLMHEFAAASYYAYDIKGAVAAIQKALKLKPEEPLIQRSASMIYAAVGDFKAAEKHFKIFQAKVGQDSEVSHVANRVSDWQHLYNSGRLTLAANKSTASDSTDSSSDSSASSKSGSKPSSKSDSSADSSSSSKSDSTSSSDSKSSGSNGDDTKPTDGDSEDVGLTVDSPFESESDIPRKDEFKRGNLGANIVDVPVTPGISPPSADKGQSQPPGAQAAASAPKPPAEPTNQQIIIDCYLLEINENASSSKGNNILNTLAVTLSPGSFVTFKGDLHGSGTVPPNRDSSPSLSNGHTVNTTSGSGFATGVDATGKIINSAPANAGISTVLGTTGSLAGRIFTGGISWAGLTYSLNIANAADARTELISRPTLMTHLKKESRFFSGIELVNVGTGGYGSNLSRYQVGVSVTVLPQTLVGELVTLDIGLETSNLQSINPNLLATVDVGKTRLETTARVNLGETIMLGGMYRRIELQAKGGFPGLKDVPIVQYFFSQEATSSTRSSIVILLTPRSPDLVKSAVNRAMAKESVQPHYSELLARNPDWFHPHANAINIFGYLNLDPSIYYEFRTGDILPPSWGYEPALSDKLAELSSFLYF